MNPAHVHLMLNHFSIIGSIFGLVLLVVAMVRNSRELITVSLACLASVAIISIPVYFTGPPAEEAIKRLAGISEEVVERHEEAAQFAFTGIECVGALALAGLWLFRTKPPPRWFLAILLVGALLTVGVMVYTANQGRQIRHPEITRSSLGGSSTVARAGVFQPKRHDVATTLKRRTSAPTFFATWVATSKPRATRVVVVGQIDLMPSGRCRLPPDRLKTNKNASPL